MANGAETWLLVALAGFQLWVASRWWRGPVLPGTRGWVVGLFVLNGTATALAALHVVSGAAAVGAVGNAVDRWTNLFLLGFCVTGLGLFHRARRFAIALVVLSSVGLVATFPAEVTGDEALKLGDWHLPIVEAPLITAMVLAGVAIVRLLRARPSPTRDAWLLLLAAVGMRFSELGALWLYDIVAGLVAAEVAAVLHATAQMLATAAMLAAFAVLAARLVRAGTPDPAPVDIALFLLLAGFLLGAAETLAPAPPLTILYLSFGFVRPMVFAFTRAKLAGHTPRESEEAPIIVKGAVLTVVAILGATIAELAWEWTAPAAFLVGGVGVALLAPVLARIPIRMARREASTANAEGAFTAQPTAVDAAGWPIQVDRVSLPDDWHAQVERAFEEFRLLPAENQRALADLNHWHRIVLALDAVPESVAENAFERTTSSLHLWTHCPYASIGSEIARANGRHRAILAELGIHAPPAPERQALVASTWGRVPGLQSGRVKLYRLTPLGRRVANRLRARHGFDAIESEVLGRIVGSGFAAAAGIMGANESVRPIR